jgi:hypothetical protein
VPGGIVGVGTTVSGCEIFPNDNAWNVEVDGPNVQVIHTYDSELSQSTNLHPDWGAYTGKDSAGIPFNVVPATQADLDTKFTLYASESDPGPGGWIGASLPGDQHALILEQGSSGCTLYEGWNCVVVSAAPFSCANGAVFNLASNTLRPLGMTSADAAGLAVLPGLVKINEVLTAKVITHAIRVTFSTSQQGYIAPATHAAGSKALGSAYVPMGLRLRMKASVATSSYTAASQVIMAAMKKYGVLIADNGSDWYFQGDGDDGWTATAPDGQDTYISEITSDFSNITGADFEAIYTGDPIATGL